MNIHHVCSKLCENWMLYLMNWMLFLMNWMLYLMQLIAIILCALLTLRLSAENKYINEFTLKSMKFVVYGDLATVGRTCFCTPKYDGKLSHVQSLHPHSSTIPHIQHVPVFLLMGNNCRQHICIQYCRQEYVNVKIYPAICFDSSLFNEVQRQCALHMFKIVILEGLSTQKLYAFNYSLFLCFVWTSENSSIVSINKISWFVFITYTELVKRRPKLILLEVKLIPILNSSVFHFI